MQGLPLSGRKAELVNRLRKHGDSRWHALTVRELQKLLRERGLQVSGLKRELVARLVESDCERQEMDCKQQMMFSGIPRPASEQVKVPIPTSQMTGVVQDVMAFGVFVELMLEQQKLWGFIPVSELKKELLGGENQKHVKEGAFQAGEEVQVRAVPNTASDQLILSIDQAEPGP
ncbi:unnamed protein product [Durusdinium trenchii]|uniref:Uncharacterized protein n=2 Tax=Durusdinium trenchii TaxID=1381693 RepID=A0ABP0QPK9_9DINO